MEHTFDAGHVPAPSGHAATTEKEPLRYRLLAKLMPRLRRYLPFTPAGDRLYHKALFLKKHHRLPRDQMMWNDVWYRIKATDEILEPVRVFVSDKEHVKQYVKAVVGDEYNVPTITVLRSPQEVDFYDFPARCCIKPTQASAQVILRKNGEPIDLARIKSWFRLNYYYAGREANYRTLRPKVIVEPLIFDSPDVEDYRIFCYQGEPRLIQVDLDRHTNHTRKIYDIDWNEQDFSILYPRSTKTLKKPDTLPEMLAIARKLAAPFSLVRVDLYSNDKLIYVGEITNCSANAGGIFRPLSAEKKASELMFG